MATGALSFSGRVALITGGSSGIGAATVLLLSKLGCSVALGGRNKENLYDVAAKCKETRGDAQVLPVQGDLDNDEDVKTLLETTVGHFGKLDILVNNAGVLNAGSIENTSLEAFDATMRTNVRSVFHLTSLAVPYLIETQGCIVNVSSVNGLRSFPGVLAYNISKSAVDQFTRCVALELAPKKVRCNSVNRQPSDLFKSGSISEPLQCPSVVYNPGVITTGLQKRGGLDEKTYQEFLERSKTTHALGRPGNAEEVASAIAFLASNEASFITGASLPVDGGRHAMCPR